MDVYTDLMRAPPRIRGTRQEEDMAEQHPILQAMGGLAGSIVLAMSIIFLVLSGVAILLTERHARQEFLVSYKPGSTLKYWTDIAYAYGSAASLLMSMIIEHVFVYIIIGTEVLSCDQHDQLRIRWMRYIKFVLPCYWIFFVAEEACLITAIIGLQRREYLWIPFSIAPYVDIMAFILIVCLHWVAVKIQWSISVRDRINALPELVVETDDFEDCVICIDTPARGDSVRRLPCHHTFHTACIDQWLIEKPSCPICKARI